MDEDLMKIDLEDLQNLIIEHKFVGINTSKYTENALSYIKYLIDKEQALLFEEDTHRIYTLGQYYGGDELKEKLLYFSKLLAIDVDNNILDEIESSKNSDILAIRGKDALKINFIKDKYNTVEFEYSLTNAIDNNIFKFNEDSEYNLYINQNGQIALYEYKYPKINIIPKQLLPDDEETQIYDFEIISSVDFSVWEKFNIDGENCIIDNVDYEHQQITVILNKGVDATITIVYSDGRKEDTYKYIQKWHKQCEYGLFDGMNYISFGITYFLDDNIEPIIIDQQYKYTAYVILPININPVFLDNITKTQGAWHKVNATFINQNFYKLYMTDNSGLGKISWKIINKNI